MSELVQHLTRALDTGMIAVRRDGQSHVIRLVALDLDGTLLTGEKRLNPATVRAVHECVKQGVKVVLASARPPRAVRKVWEILGLNTLSIHYNGALIHDLAEGQPVFHQPLEVALVRQVVAAARRTVADCFVHVEVLDQWYTDRYDPKFVPESGRASEPDVVGPVDSFLTAPVTKLMFLTTPQKLVKIRAVLDRRFAGRFVMAVSDDHLLQVMHLRADKAFALARVAE
ncbi:MAG: HAD-IIB family hydrolase, partial [Phycisphaerae bacterium]|nr:HAD-IIB family hydrolase [Phycisphaerae bacterium]